MAFDLATKSAEEVEITIGENFGKRKRAQRREEKEKGHSIYTIIEGEKTGVSSRKRG